LCFFVAIPLFQFQNFLRHVSRRIKFPHRRHEKGIVVQVISEPAGPLQRAVPATQLGETSDEVEGGINGFHELEAKSDRDEPRTASS
jgi:hypothetical protein